ncbi:MAG TPA: UUP1 family membrane protein [Polyangiaceae bacterium]|nr:UUP1 family membrane protein [Polyangiaceae bacterium]
MLGSRLRRAFAALLSLRTMVLLLVVVPLAVASYKVRNLGFDVEDLLPQKVYRVSYEMSLDGHGGDATIRSFLPVSSPHQTISDEQGESDHFTLTSQSSGLNRTATWTGDSVPDHARIEYSFSALVRPVRFELSPLMTVPTSYPESIASALRPEPAIQVDSLEIAATLRKIRADQGPILARLRKIFDFTSSLRARKFKGTTDALTALRLGEASCNGKSRLFVALARAAGIPARLVGGLILGGEAKRTSHQWVEAWVAGHWVPFCPTNDYFASLPERYLTLYYGDESLFTHTSDLNFDYKFSTTASLTPSPKAKQWAPSINVWALFERLHLSFALLRTVLMLPIGALVVVLFRNVVGVPTFGTFLPALLAAAAGETGASWGVFGVLAIVFVTAVLRGVFQHFRLLHSPTLAILLAGVTTTMLATSLLAERFELGKLTYVALFPIAVLAITAERFYLAATERSLTDAVKELGGTLLVMLCCYVVMNSLALQALLIGFPEALLLVVAANIYLGRWIGLRVSEYLRFRHVLVPAKDLAR